MRPRYVRCAKSPRRKAIGVALRLGNDTPPPDGWTAHEWAYLCGIAAAQVLMLRDRLRPDVDSRDVGAGKLEP